MTRRNLREITHGLAKARRPQGESAPLTGTIDQLCTHESILKYIGLILQERWLHKEKPAGFMLNVRRTFPVSYTSPLMKYINDEADHLPIITIQACPRVALYL